MAEEDMFQGAWSITNHTGRLRTRAITYDKALRLTQRRIDNVVAGTGFHLREDFAYNPASQLIGYTVDNTDYLYTGNDNLTGAYEVNGLNQYTSVSGTAFTYDLNGNLTSDGASTYAYDS